MKKIRLLGLLVLGISCRSVEFGPTVMTDGYAVETSLLTNGDGRVKAGARVGVGQVRMTDGWKEKFGSTTERYSLEGLARCDLGRGFYVEPALGAAHYPGIGTEIEPEGRLRLGFAWKQVQVAIGARYGFGNGHNHDEPEHIQSSGEVRPEAGLHFSYRW